VVPARGGFGSGGEELSRRLAPGFRRRRAAQDREEEFRRSAALAGRRRPPSGGLSFSGLRPIAQASASESCRYGVDMCRHAFSLGGLVRPSGDGRQWAEARAVPRQLSLNRLEPPRSCRFKRIDGSPLFGNWVRVRQRSPGSATAVSFRSPPRRQRSLPGSAPGDSIRNRP
jgi:hypothetical protein